MFSFKNAVDDFYMAYLEKESILCEVYIVKGSADNSSKNTVKLGEARLPLSPLLSDEKVGF